jgi:23S rRNA maturation-related 3'-5' exoribonuclease YhaM
MTLKMCRRMGAGAKPIGFMPTNRGNALWYTNRGNVLGHAQFDMEAVAQLIGSY